MTPEDFVIVGGVQWPTEPEPEVIPFLEPGGPAAIQAWIDRVRLDPHPKETK